MAKGFDMEKPWVTGPKELLQHGLEHLTKNTDLDRRIAMISIDNAVELTIKTYLSLPRRATGINISRTEYEKTSESFPRLLDALEQCANDKLVGIDLVDLEWYHRLRNKIYHEGSGITVERQKAENYAEIAKILFQNLFETPMEVPKDIRPTVIGEFIGKWAGLERALHNMVVSRAPEGAVRFEPPSMLIRQLRHLGLVSEDFIKSFDEIRVFRNDLVHGLATPSVEQVEDHLSKLTHLLKELNVE